MNTSTNNDHVQKELEELELRLAGLDQVISRNENTLCEVMTATINGPDIETSLISSTKALRFYRKVQVAFYAELRSELAIAEKRKIVGLDRTISENEKTPTEVETGTISGPDIMTSLISSIEHLKEYRRLQVAAIAEVRKETTEPGQLHNNENSPS